MIHTGNEPAGFHQRHEPLESWLNWGWDRFSGYVDYTTGFALPADAREVQLGQGELRAKVPAPAAGRSNPCHMALAGFCHHKLGT
jgi:hypothetical protein